MLSANRESDFGGRHASPFRLEETSPQNSLAPPGTANKSQLGSTGKFAHHTGGMACPVHAQLSVAALESRWSATIRGTASQFESLEERRFTWIALLP